MELKATKKLTKKLEPTIKDAKKLVKEIEPTIKDVSNSVLNILKNGYNQVKINKDILQQKLLIEKAKMKIGDIVVKQGIKAGTKDIEDQVKKIKGYNEKIANYQKALKVLDKNNKKKK